MSSLSTSLNPMDVHIPYTHPEGDASDTSIGKGKLREGAFYHPESVGAIWTARIAQDDAHFSREEATLLDPVKQREVVYQANQGCAVRVLRALRSCGVVSPTIAIPGPALFSLGQDVCQVEDTTKDFLRSLEAQGALLTRSQFLLLGPTKYMSKGGDLGRMQGKFYIERVAAMLGATSIKVPKKIVVVEESEPVLYLGLTKDYELIARRGYQDPVQMTIYAEKVIEVSRTITLQEATELMRVIAETGFNDFMGKNIMIAIDGIYFVDTEYHNFSPTEEPAFDAIQSIQNLLQPEDVSTFLADYRKFRAAYDATQEVREARRAAYDAIARDPYANLLVRSTRKKAMQIDLRTLFPMGF